MLLFHKRLTFVVSVIIIFLLNMSAIAQKTLPDFSKQLFDKHEDYRESSLNKRRFKHRDLVPLFEKLPFEVQKIGKSFEERDIYQIKLGNGKTKVLLWSQMHGNEATATMALLDIFKFFEAKNDIFDDLRSKISEKCTLL